MKLVYGGNWESLVEYLEDKDCIFFVRKNEIELVLETGSIFIQKEPVLFRCRVLPFPIERINKSICKKDGKVLAFINRPAIV